MRVLAAAALATCLAAAAASALEVQRHDVTAEQDRPEVCVTFDAPLAEPRGVTFSDYVAVEPAQPVDVRVRGERLCVAGLLHGARATLRLREGLPDRDGGGLAGDVRLEVYVPDRAPFVRFPNGGQVLARDAAGVPVVAVNVERVELDLYRVAQPGLVEALKSGRVGQSLNRWGEQGLADEQARPVWHGTFESGGARNRPVELLVPVAAVLGGQAPGLYVAVARPEGTQAPEWQQQATQWFVVSDLGLAAFRADDGLLVQARDLADARPLAGATVSLLAQGNDVLGTLETDEAGLARFPAGLLRGHGAGRPRAVLAETGGGDFAFIDLEGVTLDLTDRGIDGRPPPGPLDAFVFTERGIYRPGETMHAFALLRDDRARGVAGLPLTFRLLRPDGETFRDAVRPDTAGGYAWSADLPATAPTGEWLLQVLADPDGRPLGQATLQVGDFVPPQIEVTATAGDAAAAPGGSLTVIAEAAFLYGAPGAGLAGQATVTVRRPEQPFDGAWPGYGFGLVQEPFHAERQEPLGFATDDAGRAVLDVALPAAPDTTQPLEVAVETTVFDLAGRPVSAELVRPFPHRDFHIGVRPAFEGSAPEDGSAAFEVVAVGPAGERVARDGLRWAAFKENRHYTWYNQGGDWRSEVTIVDEPVAGGDLAVAADRPATLAVPVAWGNYRIEVFEADGPVATSVRFDAGWYGGEAASERPDAATISLDRELYRPGDVARVRVEAPYPADVLVMAVDGGIREVRQVRTGPDGAVVELRVGADWTPGAYVVAHAYATAAEAGGPLPRRAVGVAWLPLDGSPRTLAATLEVPETIEPNRTLDAILRVDGAAAGETVHAVLMAVDDGVLGLTGHEAPDPAGWYHGRRALGLVQYDLWGRLIDATGDRIADLRFGGDGMADLGFAGMPDRNTEVLALASGIVEVGDDGMVRVPFELPDFNGRVRVMAVAWSGDRVGSAEATVLVRSPLVADLTLPRFLAPGDRADILLSLRNLAGPPGDYRAQLTTQGPVSLDRAEIRADGLAAGGEAREALALTATAAGDGTIRLSVGGPDGFALERRRTIAVRPASSPVQVRSFATLAPGEVFRPDAAAQGDFVPQSVTLTLDAGPLAGLDVAGLVRRLDTYPYGCVEQTTSRALPLVYADDLGVGDVLGDRASVRQRLQQAIYRIVAFQSQAGGFALWGGQHGGDLWMTAYVLDFLVRAAEADLHVPEQARVRAAGWIADRIADLPEARDAWRLAEHAYGHYALARAGRTQLAAVRYFHETRFDDLPTPTAQAQVAAALARLGDRPRAEAAFARLRERAARPESDRWRDYGSTLRDHAAVLALMAESGVVGPAVLRSRLDDLVAAERGRRYLSTQEMGWMVLAAHALRQQAGPLALAVDGRPLPAGRSAWRTRIAPGGAVPELRNDGDRPVLVAMTAAGLPVAPLPAEQSGFVLRRYFFDMTGQPLDLEAIRRNDSFVMTLEGRATGEGRHRALAVHLLPAGWELEDIRLTGGQPAQLPWLGELTSVERLELRDDRFMAQVDVDGGEAGFRVAFVVRAVTTGTFALPGATVEDMYRPELFARQASGRITVLPRP